MKKRKTKQKPRPPFSDGLNSWWHFAFGWAAHYAPVVVTQLFRAYQRLRVDVNTPVDLKEFRVGRRAARLGLRGFEKW